MIRRGAVRGLQLLVVLALVALLAGQVLGQPILLGYVETGSMEPTIETGDGFVAIPSELTGEPETGDVVVYDAEEIEGGGLTTHRVVDETDRGYVTQGDANAFTDQDGGEPYVQEEQIVATAWQPTGEVLAVPNLGTAIMGVGDGLDRGQSWLAVTVGTRALLGSDGLAIVLLGFSISLYAIETLRERRGPPTDSRLDRGDDDVSIDPRLLAAGFAAMIVVAAAAAMLVPAGTHSYDVVSAEFDSDRPLVIEQGTTEEVAYPVPNAGLVPTVSYVEGGDGATVERDRVTAGPRDEREVTVSIAAPAETGYYPTYVEEHRYLHVLPVPVIDALYEVHPWMPFLAIVTLLGGGSYAVGRRVLGPGDPRSRREATRRNCTERRSSLQRWF